MLSEYVKESIRWILFPFLPGEVKARRGTLWFKFLGWLYGEDEMRAEFPCIWPSEDGNERH